MIQEFKKVNSVKGSLTFSGDKSISHRALIISSLANGISEITNLSIGEDVKSTINCLSSLGIKIEYSQQKSIVVSYGFKGFKKPDGPLFAGNSGTTARLLSGILSMQDFNSIVTGDSSLSSRPMSRIIEPLTQMGGNLSTSKYGTLPLHINRPNKLQAIKYELPVPSAQVKSAILFAGLCLNDETTVIESIQTRNHTENLLDLTVDKKNNKFITTASHKNYPIAKNYFIPGDISSAMFFVILALLTKNSELVLRDVSLNQTRIECINLLMRMGGNIEINEKGKSNKEVYGDIIVRSSELQNVNIDKKIIPLIIDEIPLLTIAGIFADGIFQLNGASELRVKESDRIKAICINLLKLGLEVEEYQDGFSVTGTIKKSSGTFDSFGDHRIAMTFAILSSLLTEGNKVENFDCVSVSNPDFLKQLSSIAS